MNAPTNRTTPPATEGEIKALMTEAHARANGTITEAAAGQWRRDLLPLGFAFADVRQALMALPMHAANEARPFATRGRPQWDDVLDLCKSFRTIRRNREQRITDTSRQLAERSAVVRDTSDRRRTMLATRVLLAMSRMRKDATNEQWDAWRDLPIDELEAFAREVETEANRQCGAPKLDVRGMVDRMIAGKEIE